MCLQTFKKSGFERTKSPFNKTGFSCCFQTKLKRDCSVPPCTIEQSNSALIEIRIMGCNWSYGKPRILGSCSCTFYFCSKMEKYRKIFWRKKKISFAEKKPLLPELIGLTDLCSPLLTTGVTQKNGDDFLVLIIRPSRHLDPGIWMFFYVTFLNIK